MTSHLSDESDHWSATFSIWIIVKRINIYTNSYSIREIKLTWVATQKLIILIPFSFRRLDIRVTKFFVENMLSHDVQANDTMQSVSLKYGISVNFDFIKEKFVSITVRNLPFSEPIAFGPVTPYIHARLFKFQSTDGMMSRWKRVAEEISTFQPIILKSLWMQTRM